MAIDSASLESYTPQAIFGGGSGAGDGKCFDTAPCFSKGAVVAVEMSTCSIAKPAAGTGVNVALVMPAGSAGICGAATCLIPLDANAETGWREEAGRLVLPPAACERLNTGAVTGVSVTTSCETKTERTPTCGPWSSVDASSGEPDGGTGGGGGTSECKPTDSSCYVSGAQGAGNDCLAKADFSAAAVTQLRMTSHRVESPAAMAAPFVQDNIITAGSTLEEPSCNLNGTGRFNFLVQVNTEKKELTLGGGVQQALVGPALGGTCWAAFTDPASGLEVKQHVTTYTEIGGELQAKLVSFVMPIYLDDQAQLGSAMLVPIREMTFRARLSADKNCVGRYAAEKLDKALSCQPPGGQFAWEAAGTYEGYIMVDDADKVMVVSVDQSLCVVLTGDPSKWKGTGKDCKTSKGFTDTGAMPKGDWCSMTNSAGGCQDAWRLVIDFAAQAIKINGVFDSSKNGC
ncbi:MAG: hypothetical protein HYZ29_08105 [Myxococcales bacterium]|nr:hypothetical protein [Myxococcales bacterium]